MKAFIDFIVTTVFWVFVMAAVVMFIWNWRLSYIAIISYRDAVYLTTMIWSISLIHRGWEPTKTDNTNYDMETE